MCPFINNSIVSMKKGKYSFTMHVSASVKSLLLWDVHPV